MLEDFSFTYIQNALKEGLQVMEQRELYEFLSKTKCKRIVVQDTDPPSASSLESNPFVSTELKAKVKRLSKKSSFIFQSNEIKVSINVFWDKESLEQIQDLVQHVSSIIDFMDHFAHNETIHNLTVSLYLLDDKKRVGKEKILGKDNVNGGSTSRGTDVSVEVWRKEEVLKVTIHELIHAFSYDHPQEPLTLLQHYQHKYNVSSKNINTYEAYTEMWAEIIHCYYLASFILKQKKLDISEYDLFRTFLQIERQFSLKQGQKVLQLHDAKKPYDMNQGTNVLSYYIIVGEMYENLQEFVAFCQKKNKDFIVIKDLDAYFRYLKDLKKIQKTNKMDKMVTGRMTICELKLF